MVSTDEHRNQADQGVNAQRRCLAIAHDEPVVEEIVGVVPQTQALAAEVGHRPADHQEMLEELGRDVLIGIVVLRQFDGDAQHVQAVHRHPGRSVGLHQHAIDGQRSGPVEDADIVHAEEATFEDVQAARVLAVHPPGEIEQQLGENPLEKPAVAFAVALPLRIVEAQSRPGLHGRIDVAEVPFVSRQLPVRVHVPGLAEQDQLTLGVLQIEISQRGQMKGPVPARKPGKLPFVGHRDDVFHGGMNPLVVAPGVAGPGWLGFCRVTIQPFRDVVIVVLLRPKDARESLALNAAQVLVQHLGLQLGIESVGLGFAQAEDLVEIGEGCGLGRARAQPDPDGGAGARRNGPPVDGGRLRALMRTDRVLAARPPDIRGSRPCTNVLSLRSRIAWRHWSRYRRT